MKKLCSLLWAVVITVLMAACSSPSTPSEVVDDYYALLKNGDVEKAMSEYTTESNEEIQKTVEKVDGLQFKINSYEIESEDIAEDGESATVVVKKSFTSSMNDNEKSDKDKVHLKKVDGKWKIFD